MGKKRVRGMAVNEWGEIKKDVTVSITPTALANLQEIAETLGISRSELVERLGRSIDKIFKVEELRQELSRQSLENQELQSA